MDPKTTQRIRPPLTPAGNATVRTRRTRNSGETKFFMTTISKIRIRVCKALFLSALNIKRYRLEGIAQHVLRKGTLRKENRGGDRKTRKYEPKRQSVEGFIKRLKARESHYDRKKSKKLYLPAELKSVRKLWIQYNNIVDGTLRVKYEYFRRIFKTKFRIGFGSPKTDACSTCERLENEIKTEKDAIKKQKLLTDKRIHKKRANAFYEALDGYRRGLKTFSFDHQKNLVLPKVPDQQAYYSRQMYIYNFTVVELREDRQQSKDNVFIYTWMETDFPKNSSICASAVFDVLNRTDFDEIDTVRLVADACGGQNKNCAMIYMVCHWLQRHAPHHLKRVEIVFPVRGHSFLPSDRVFGVIEKKLRKEPRIYKPQEYYHVFSDSGTVRKPGEDWSALNFKEAADASLKKPLPIKIQESKRFLISKGRKQAEPNYKVQLNDPVYITKKGHTFGKIAQSFPLGTDLKPAKIKDIEKLLVGHVGEDWQNDDRFQFLKSVVNGSERGGTANEDEEPNEEEESDEEEPCDCLGEDEESQYV